MNGDCNVLVRVLAVMGDSGHTRTAELVLGGVARAVPESLTVPVLASH